MARKNLDDVQPIELIVENDKPMVSSLQVAKHFERSHDNVLRDIRGLIKELPKAWAALNFEDTEIDTTIPASGGIRKDPAYMVTRDGFTMLAMTFTSRKALAWKVKYIAAFNDMERVLIERQIESARTPLIAAPVCENPATRKIRIIKSLRGYIAYWAFVDGIPLEVAEASACAFADIRQLEDIAPENYAEVIAYLVRVSHVPSQEGAPATCEQIQIIRYMLEACAQFKHTRDHDFAEYFQDFYKVTVKDLMNLTEQGAQKITAGLWGLFNQAWRYTAVCSEYEH